MTIPKTPSSSLRRRPRETNRAYKKRSERGETLPERHPERNSMLVPAYIAYPFWVVCAVAFLARDWIAVAYVHAYAWLFNLDCSKNPAFNCLMISDADRSYFDQGLSVISISVGAIVFLGLTYVLLRQILRARK
ncbi:hypothetical protein [Burkholderia cenocepacia]|uniref:hypothetical protein n=1 Tax=Burkholderia cenocepacia TaxID=95486 RepID=UPI00396B3EEE